MSTNEAIATKANRVQTFETGNADILAESHLTFERWLERRRLAVSAISRLQADIVRAKRQQQVIDAVSDWRRACLDRLAQDADDQLRFGLAWAGFVGSTASVFLHANASTSPGAHGSISRNGG